MWSQKPLLLVVISLQIRLNFAQLRNLTHSADQILDAYDPAFHSKNVTITRIIGGKAVDIRQVPWQVAIYRNRRFKCGGSIISRDWVLTAAHCMVPGGNYGIQVGSSYYKQISKQFRVPDVIIVNTGYNLNTLNHDIALIRVNKKFIWNRRVKPVKIARRNRRLPPRYFISGWGDTSGNGTYPRQLRGVTIRRVPRPICIKKYRGERLSITKNMICAAAPGKDACQGDSGGPLVHKGIQYGITSFGIGCARPQYPGVFTNIRREIPWMRRVIKKWGGQSPQYV